MDVASIQEAFQSQNLSIQSDALDYCRQLCTELSISPETLVETWDVYSMNHSITTSASVLDMTRLRDFYLQGKKRQKVNNKENSHTTPVVKRERHRNHNDKESTKESLSSIYGAEFLKSPTITRPMTFQSPNAIKVEKVQSLFLPLSIQSPNGKYESRKDAGKIVDEFNEDLKMKFKDMERMDIDITMPSKDQNTSSSFAYMYTPLPERCAALEKQLCEAEDDWMMKMDIDELGIIGDPSPAQATFVGRICCEASEGKLNVGVVTLEGSRRTCGGQRTLLDLSHVTDFTLFPGKIVAIEGILDNIRAPMKVISLLNTLTPAPKDPETESLEPSTTSEPPTVPESSMEASLDDAPMEMDVETDSGKIELLVACGPYTPSSDVQYMPFYDLIEVARNKKPQVLVLMGPFIDATHANFKDGMAQYEGMNMNFSDIFLFRMIAEVDKLMGENENIHVILIPSLRDAHHDYVFPQPPFTEKKKIYEICSHKDRLHLLSNPSTFSVNGIVIGASTIDALYQLGSNDVNRTAPGTTKKPRMLRLAEQLIEQRSFYPIYPPPPTGDAPVDIRYYPQFQMKDAPDVLLLSSLLNRFCGSVQDTLCLNPGTLAKGSSGGTYAWITAPPCVEEGSERTKFATQTHVEIRRI